jgi:hypothetical protein
MVLLFCPNPRRSHLLIVNASKKFGWFVRNKPIELFPHWWVAMEASLDRQKDDKIPRVSSAAFDTFPPFDPMLTTQTFSNVNKAAENLLISAIQYNPHTTEGTSLSRFQSREQCETVDSYTISDSLLRGVEDDKIMMGEVGDDVLIPPHRSR